jgi:response regulator RpfG family c-di-GMP phosphodiesterase
MPEMDGLEVCRAIKNDPELSDLNVIITTGYPDHPKLKEVSNLGFDTIYSKPFHIKNLLNKIDSLFAEKKHLFNSLNAYSQLKMEPARDNEIDPKQLNYTCRR